MASLQRSARRAAQRVKYDRWRQGQRRLWHSRREKGDRVPSFKGWLQRAAKATGGKLPWIGEKGKPWLPPFLRGLFKVEKVEVSDE